MEVPSVFKLFLIAIFILSFVNVSFADSGPSIEESQAKSIVNDYLDDKNLPYQANTATWMIEIKNRDTQSTKWVSVSQWDVMTDNNKFLPEEDPNFEWECTGSYAWKVNVVNDQGGSVGTIWLDSESGKITEVNVQAVPKDTKPTNNTNQTVNNTNQTTAGPLSTVTALVLFIVVIAVIGIAGYLIYQRRA